jgi:hypothetical protein
MPDVARRATRPKPCGGALIAVAILLSSPAWAQETPTRPGLAVDKNGGPTIDPTENVKALTAAGLKSANDALVATEKLLQAKMESVKELETSLREAETRRINELAAQKQVFDLELARVIRANVDASTTLLAAQLKELKTDLGLKIEQGARDISDRVTKLEQYANETRGRAIAADPAYAKALEEVRALSQSRAEATGVGIGSAAVWGLVAFLFLALLTIIGLVFRFMQMPRRTEP